MNIRITGTSVYGCHSTKCPIKDNCRLYNKGKRGRWPETKTTFAVKEGLWESNHYVLVSTICIEKANR